MQFGGAVTDIKSAESRPETSRRFEETFCWVLITLILAIVASICIVIFTNFSY
jgi:hypothetical protein